MRCETCDNPRCRCVDSRPMDGGNRRRRRYLCPNGHRFTTFETYGNDPAWMSEEVLRLLTEDSGVLGALVKEKVKMITDKRSEK